MSEQPPTHDPNQQQPPPMPGGGSQPESVPPPMPSGQSAPPHDPQHGAKARAKEQFKSTANDSWSSVKGLWENPETGIGNALNQLGQQKVMFTGIFLIASIAIANYFLIRMAAPSELASLFTLENSFRLIVQLSFPSLAFAIAFQLANVVLKSERNFKDCLFMAGMVSLPFLLPSLGLLVLGYSNVELHVAIVVASLCFLALLTYATYRHALDCEARKSFILTPLTLLAMVYITSVFSRRWMEEWMGSFLYGLGI